MSVTKTCDCPELKDEKLLKRALEEVMGWQVDETAGLEPKDQPQAFMYGGKPVQAPVLVVNRKSTGGIYGDFAVVRNPDGTLKMVYDGHDHWKTKEGKPIGADKLVQESQKLIKQSYNKAYMDRQHKQIAAKTVSGWAPTQNGGVKTRIALRKKDLAFLRTK